MSEASLADEICDVDDKLGETILAIDNSKGRTRSVLSSVRKLREKAMKVHSRLFESEAANGCAQPLFPTIITTLMCFQTLPDVICEAFHMAMRRCSPGCQAGSLPSPTATPKAPLSVRTSGSSFHLTNTSFKSRPTANSLPSQQPNPPNVSSESMSACPTADSDTPFLSQDGNQWSFLGLSRSLLLGNLMDDDKATQRHFRSRRTLFEERISRKREEEETALRRQIQPTSYCYYRYRFYYYTSFCTTTAWRHTSHEMLQARRFQFKAQEPQSLPTGGGLTYGERKSVNSVESSVTVESVGVEFTFPEVYQACREGDLEFIKKHTTQGELERRGLLVLKRGFLLRRKKAKGHDVKILEKLCLLAVRCGHRDIVAYLIKQGKVKSLTGRSSKGKKIAKTAAYQHSDYILLVFPVDR
eukprot:jgi/Bigna1/71947/fgenesh1_pg.17_\